MRGNFGKPLCLHNAPTDRIGDGPGRVDGNLNMYTLYRFSNATVFGDFPRTRLGSLNRPTHLA